MTFFISESDIPRYSHVQYVAVMVLTLTYVAVMCCSMLQSCFVLCRSHVLQHVVCMCCSMLQSCAAVCCSDVLQYGAVVLLTLQHVAALPNTRIFQ